MTQHTLARNQYIDMSTFDDVPALTALCSNYGECLMEGNSRVLCA